MCITKLFYNEQTDSVEIIDTKNIISHFIGIDFNSLYPSSFSGAYHDCNPYTCHKMYMPGRVTEEIIVKNEAQLRRCLAIINSKDRFTDKGQLFVVKLKGHIPKNKLNKCINFLPIIRNVNVSTEKWIIGDYMYNYLNYT